MTDKPSNSELVGHLHEWFESIRLDGGYGGPVSHWWRHSLRYAGPGLDWRYEGLIHGYLNLYQTTGNTRWLSAAVRAGRDLTAGQLASGNYASSAFERNPESGGTPHEACVSAALFRLSRTCRSEELEWESFAEAARRNLRWHVDALWNERDGAFSDTVGMRSYVPNKIASTVDAFVRLAEFDDETSLYDAYVRPAAEAITALQVESGNHRGAIHQLSHDGTNNGDGKFFPLYIARCVPPLLTVGNRLGDQRFIDAAVAAGEFLKSVERSDGSFPQVVYRSGQRNDVPRWIAGVGDVLRAYDRLAERGYDFPTSATERWLRSGFDECGAFQTAKGFGRLTGDSTGPVVYDLLHVAGWNDKAFRWLTDSVTEVAADVTNAESSVTCTHDGRSGTFTETENLIAFEPNERRDPVFLWEKDSRWTKWGTNTSWEETVGERTNGRNESQSL